MSASATEPSSKSRKRRSCSCFETMTLSTDRALNKQGNLFFQEGPSEKKRFHIPRRPAQRLQPSHPFCPSNCRRESGGQSPEPRLLIQFSYWTVRVNVDEEDLRFAQFGLVYRVQDENCCLRAISWQQGSSWDCSSERSHSVSSHTSQWRKLTNIELTHLGKETPCKARGHKLGGFGHHRKTVLVMVRLPESLVGL